jgi:uncharacterized protein (DUF1697 family)
MNVGGRRLTNRELCGHIEALGFRDVSAFLASGNVVFDAGERQDVRERIEEGLREALGYDVPTFLRTAQEVVDIATRDVFGADLLATHGKEQVVLLQGEPAPDVANALLALSCDDDRLALHGTELHWLPRGSVLDTTLDWKQIERDVGATTTRTRNTVRRLATKHFAG